MESTIALPADLKLIVGVGDRNNHTACIMSAVAWIAGEPHSDAPKCACPVIRRLAIRLNDGKWWSDGAERTAELLPLAKRLVGSKSTPSIEIARAKVAAEWALTFAAPFALDAAASVVPEPHKAKLTEFAAKMREKADAQLARAAANAAYAAAYAAADAAYAAAYAAADAAYANAAYANAAAYAAYAANAAANAANAANAAANAANAERLARKRPLRDALKSLVERLLETK